MLQVCKVYIGSFNASNPIRDDVNPHGKELFEKEQANLLQDLFEISQRSTDRKVGHKIPDSRQAAGIANNRWLELPCTGLCAWPQLTCALVHTV